MQFYLKYCTESEWLALSETIHSEWPEYEEVFAIFAKNSLYFPCNILFARKEVFDGYCEFMFGVTNKIRKWFKKHKIEERLRYIGYLTEVLENLYFLYHKDDLKIAYMDIFFTR